MGDSNLEKRALNRLMAGASHFGCGRFLKSISELERLEIYLHFESERLESKYKDILEYYNNEANENWNQTIFGYFFRYLGDPKNKNTYMSLAKRVGYNAILRERSDPMRVEALLLGASGLLKDYGDDHYTLTIKREAEYLMRKYNIKPLSSSDWNLYKLHPKNNPVLRLTQAATFFIENELLLDKLLQCKCIEDIEEIFTVESSEYWTTHYVPSRVSIEEVKRLGHDKSNVLGINLVVMLQFAYGSYTANDELIEQAQNLIEDLKPEANWIVSRWRNYGLRPKSALDTQALIQIGQNYCSMSRCSECYLGARAMKNFGWLDLE